MAEPSSDGELVRRCGAGEEQAWNELVERYSRYVYAIAAQGYRLAPPDAEDVFHSTAPCTGSPSPKASTTRPHAPTSPAKKPKARAEKKRCAGVDPLSLTP